VSESAMPSLIRHAQATLAEVGAGGAEDLLVHLASVADPRKARACGPGLALLLTVAAAAVLAGARSFTAIGEWAADASQDVFGGAGRGPLPADGSLRRPHEATVRRALRTVDADELDRAVSAWLAARRTVSMTATPRPAAALDGKTIRGARDHADPADRAHTGQPCRAQRRDRVGAAAGL
jgi:hypothetical protein